jgi:hypothetical protein
MYRKTLASFRWSNKIILKLTAASDKENSRERRRKDAVTDRD